MSIRSRDVVVRPQGDGAEGVRILRSEDVTLITRPRPEKRGRVRQPVIFTRTDNREWELNICIYRDGDFRRLAMPLRQARDFLTNELANVENALAHVEPAENPPQEEK